MDPKRLTQIVRLDLLVNGGNPAELANLEKAVERAYDYIEQEDLWIRRQRGPRNPDLLKGKTHVTVKTAAEYGGVTDRAIEKAIFKGKLYSVGTGPNRRIPVDDLKRYFPDDSEK